MPVWLQTAIMLWPLAIFTVAVIGCMVGIAKVHL
jgi:hypothetical protein